MSDKTDNEWTSHQFVKVCTAWCLSTKATSNRLQRRATNPNACWHPLYFRIPLGRQPVIPYPNRDDGWRLKLATGCIFVLISPALIFLFYFIFPPSFKKERRSSFVLFLLLQKKRLFLHANALHVFMRQDFHFISLQNFLWFVTLIWNFFLTEWS
jgi:hypothetical protein